MATTLQFISQVKLGELRRQRTLLVETYQRLEQDCAAQPAVERLKTLYDGLRGIKVAGKPLHPDLENLDLLLEGTSPSAEIVAFWGGRLQAELEAGRLGATSSICSAPCWGNGERATIPNRRFLSCASGRKSRFSSRR